MPATPPEELYYQKRNILTQTGAAFLVSALSNYAFCFVPVAVLGFALMEKTKETSRHCAANCSDSGDHGTASHRFCIRGDSYRTSSISWWFRAALQGHTGSLCWFGTVPYCAVALLIFSCEVSRYEHHSMSLPAGLFLRCLPHFGPLRLPPPLWSLGQCFYHRTPNIAHCFRTKCGLGLGVSSDFYW